MLYFIEQYKIYRAEVEQDIPLAYCRAC